MKRINVFLLLALAFVWLAGCAEHERGASLIAVCSLNEGCVLYRISLNKGSVDKLLQKQNFLQGASDSAIVVLENCTFKPVDNQTPAAIDRQYGGNGQVEIRQQFDLRKYLIDNDCFPEEPIPQVVADNKTKKISFVARGEGETGSGYFYINVTKGEAYMPNQSFETLHGFGGEGGVQVDAVISDNNMRQYLIDPEGKKYYVDMPMSVTLLSESEWDKQNHEYFKQNFIKTGGSKIFLNTGLKVESYMGKDYEGNPLELSLVSMRDVRLGDSKFEAAGFMGLGYLKIDGTTYLISKLATNNAVVEVTGIQDEEYTFNPMGYVPMSSLAF